MRALTRSRCSTALHLLRREIEVGLAVVADDEAVAVAMALDRALDLGEKLVADGCVGSWMLLL